MHFKQLISQFWHSVLGAWILGLTGIISIFIYLVNKKRQATKIKKYFILVH